MIRTYVYTNSRQSDPSVPWAQFIQLQAGYLEENLPPWHAALRLWDLPQEQAALYTLLGNAVTRAIEELNHTFPFLSQEERSKILVSYVDRFELRSLLEA